MHRVLQFIKDKGFTKSTQSMNNKPFEYQFFCNICGHSTFIDFKTRKNIKCAFCGSIERHRAYKLYYDKYINFTKNIKVLHFAPERKEIFYWFAKKLGENYHAFDIDIKRYKKYRYDNIKVNKLDLCNFKNKLPHNYYDYIIHNHVLEHVSCDYKKVLKYLHQSLNNDGLHMFSVPLKNYFDECFSNISQEERTERFLHPQHIRVFGKKDLHLTIGSIFNIESSSYTLPDLFDINTLIKCNIPHSRLKSFNGACMFLLKKSDIN